MEIEILTSIREVAPEAWDRLCPPDDPFSEHAFLDALEASGSARPESGWSPCHLLLREGGALVGAMPLYLKDDSYGEYIFDWGWAEAATRARIRYYPKLVSSIPFTPATGGRLLLGGPASPEDPRVRALLAGAKAVSGQVGASSLHVLFCTEAEQAALAAAGGIPRLSYQFHWENRGWPDFDAWLGTFRAHERKKVKAERRLPPGVTVREVVGEALTDAEIGAIDAFYRDTCARKGGYDYLRPGFFAGLNRGPLARRVRAFLAEREGEIVSASLCFQKGEALFGRYWGALPGYGGLHFELCYHAPIARCLAEGWRRFEAGAQGVHKLKRGLMPSPTFSAHWITHPGLSRAIADAVGREAVAVRRQMAALAEHGPFRRDGGGVHEHAMPEGPGEVGD